MVALKCKMCGGELNITNGSTVCVCEYCGSKQTVPVIDDEKKISRYERANHLRALCEFDRAYGVYESIVDELPNEAEAYFGLVLCKYGIEYVDDKKTGKKIPTCHRSSYDSILTDKNYISAIKNADDEARKQYTKEAEVLENIRKGIIEISSKEEPYDIFICYKESDKNGNRTKDSVIAQDIYENLTDKGYKVFFSKITLEGKLGVKYEPYIFSALHSSRVMLVVTTSVENVNAIWVKNEWSRYLKLIEADKKKTVIPCYRDIDVYTLPDEFADLQGQDMGKIGAMQDLIRGIEKLIPLKKPTQAEQTSPVVTSEIQNLLDRAGIFLSDSNFEKAAEYFEKVLDKNARQGEAYFGLEMANEKVQSHIELAKRYAKIKKEQSANLKHAREYAPGYSLLAEFDIAYSEELEAIKKAKEEEAKRRAELRAKKKAEEEAKKKAEEEARLKAEEEARAKAEKERIEAEKLRAKQEREQKKKEEEKRKADEEARKRREEAQRENLRRIEEERRKRLEEEARKRAEEQRYIDSLSPRQRKKYLKQKEREEYLRKNAAKIAKQKEKRKKTMKAVVGFSTIAACVVLILTFAVFIPKSNYKKGVAIFNEGNYKEAKAVFEKKSWFSNSKDYIAYCDADALASQGQNKEASLIFGSISISDSFKRSKELYWSKIQIPQTVASGYDFVIGIYADGTVKGKFDRDYMYNKEPTYDEDLISVAAGVYHAVGLRDDGTVCVLVEGSERKATKKIEKWTNVVGIYAYRHTTVGICADGSLRVATDENDSTPIDEMKKWTNVASIDMCSLRTTGAYGDDVYKYSIIAALTDGTVKYASDLNSGYKPTVESFTDVKQVSIYYQEWIGEHMILLKNDGTVVAYGVDRDGRLNVSDWNNVVQVNAIGGYNVALRADGTVYAAGSDTWNKADVSNIVNGAYLVPFDNITVINKDGTVSCPEYKSSVISGWTGLMVPNN